MPVGVSPSFDELFGTSPDVRATAPGRVNLIGEHTDYNDGFVLPSAIPQRTIVDAAREAGQQVDVWTANIGREGERGVYALGSESRGGTWLDYVQGVTSVLRESGHPLGGVRLRIESAIPLGSGLSSSAALLICMLRAMRDLFGLDRDDIALARLGLRAECDFVGAPVGIMDQMACSLADETHALFLDTRTLAYERVPLPDAAELLVIDSGIAHGHAGGEYRNRRAECERAAAALGIGSLRDLEPADLGCVDGLPEPLGRRVRHVVTENLRVLETVEALRACDLRSAGALFAASHASMRDDYEVSVPGIDLLVRLTGAHPDVYGARLTGGGFGGSIVALTARGSAREVGQAAAAEFGRRTGRPAAVLVPDPRPGSLI